MSASARACSSGLIISRARAGSRMPASDSTFATTDRVRPCSWDSTERAVARACSATARARLWCPARARAPATSANVAARSSIPLTESAMTMADSLKPACAST